MGLSVSSDCPYACRFFYAQIPRFQSSETQASPVITAPVNFIFFLISCFCFFIEPGGDLRLPFLLIVLVQNSLFTYIEIKRRVTCTAPAQLLSTNNRTSLPHNHNTSVHTAGCGAIDSPPASEPNPDHGRLDQSLRCSRLLSQVTHIPNYISQVCVFVF